MSKIQRKTSITAIICELNPPHAGHKRLVELVRDVYPNETLAAVMSGSFVQRGEPAIYQKHVRAASALDMGFDFVVELPLEGALSSAEGFARYGVALASACGASRLAFGAECGDFDALRAAAQALNSNECDERLRTELTTGISYAAARQRALAALLGDGADVLRSPNNLLAIEYIRAAAELAPQLDFHCVRREPGVSATAERLQIHNRGDSEAVLPEMLDTAVLSRLRLMGIDDFAQIRGGEDGVAERFARFAAVEGSLAELCDSAKTKRHAHSRLRRFALASALGITRDTAPMPQYIRILAANAQGREALRILSDTAPLPVITKPATAKECLKLESAATDLYNLAYPDAARRRGGAEWTTSPIMA